MSKILIALALLVVVAVAFEVKPYHHNVNFNQRARAIGGVCRPQECVKTGSQCDFNIFTNVSASTKEKLCKGGDYCKVANATTDFTGTCTDLGGVGAACTSGADCEDDLNCVNKFCNRGFLPGAKCKVPNDCLYFAENGDATVSCVSSKCAGLAAGAKCRAGSVGSCNPPMMCGTDGTCGNAVAVGTKCGSDNDCQRGAYCANATCANRIAAGGACSVLLRDSSAQCVDKYICVPNSQTTATDGTCKEAYTGDDRAICVDTSDCAEGKACLPSTEANAQHGACSPTRPSSLRSCNATVGADLSGVCADRELCVCNSNTGAGKCYLISNIVTGKGAKKAYSDVLGCTGKCARTDWPCLAKCEGKWCSYLHKELKSTENLQKNAQTCDEDDSKVQIIPGYVACSAGSFVTFSVFGLVAVVAALLM